MKIKTLIITIGVIVLLLSYNLFCYYFASNRVKELTTYPIKTYLQENNLSSNYEFIKALNNEDNSLSVYIKVDKEYYHFILLKDGAYKILEVNKDIPAYIR